jgi:cell division septation protein DedD
LAWKHVAPGPRQARELPDRLSAYHGNADAQNNLGLLYRDGHGVEPNPVVSYAWFSLAAARDNKVAERNLRRLADVMLADKILEGQQLASEYLEWITATRNASNGGRSVELSAAQGEAPETMAETAPKSDRVATTPLTLNKPVPLTKPVILTKEERFVVQLGLFRSVDGIARLEKTLGKQGFDFVKTTVTIKGTPYERFRVGPFPDPGTAHGIARRINRILSLDSAVIPVPNFTPAEARQSRSNGSASREANS